MLPLEAVLLLRGGCVVTEGRPCTAKCPLRCSLSACVSSSRNIRDTGLSSGKWRITIMSQGTEIRRSGPESASELGRMGLCMMFLRGQRMFKSQMLFQPPQENEKQKRVQTSQSISRGFTFQFHLPGQPISLSLFLRKDEEFLLHRVAAAVKREKY